MTSSQKTAKTLKKPAKKQPSQKTLKKFTKNPRKSVIMKLKNFEKSSKTCQKPKKKSDCEK
jgi:phage-related protein